MFKEQFPEASEAYEVLSDRDSRAHYDELLQKQFNLEDAQNTFENFFEEFGMEDEKEEEFFNKHYPDKILNKSKHLFEEQYQKDFILDHDKMINEQNPYSKIFSFNKINSENQERIGAEIVKTRITIILPAVFFQFPPPSPSTSPLFQ